MTDKKPHYGGAKTEADALGQWLRNVGPGEANSRRAQGLPTPTRPGTPEYRRGKR